MTNWNVVRTKPRQEALARDNLERQAYQTYLPLFLEQRRRRQRVVDVAVPLFPGYLFIQIDSSAQGLGPIRSTFGAIGIVRFGERVAVVPESVIRELKERTDPATGLIHPRQAGFSPGDKVVVANGPFAGLEGIYQAPSGVERARILIDFLGCRATATVSNASIRSAGARCPA